MHVFAECDVLGCFRGLRKVEDDNVIDTPAKANNFGTFEAMITGENGKTEGFYYLEYLIIEHA